MRYDNLDDPDDEGKDVVEWSVYHEMVVVR
jgi:hypothetical protein